MKKILQEIIDSHKAIMVFLLFSVLLLITFLTLKCFSFSGLTLEVKWILVSGLPILIGLFISGYVKTFKGFGIELESSLKSEVPNKLISPINQSNIEDEFGLDKQSLLLIDNLSNEQREKYTRIRFDLTKRKYYDGFVIAQYIHSFENLRYVEIVNSNKEFQFLIPIEYFKIRGDVSMSKIEDFTKRLENGTLDITFPNSISEYINEEDSLLKAYRKLLRSGEKITTNDKKLPVLDKNMKVIGLLSKIKVEEYISKSVLENYEENNGR